MYPTTLSPSVLPSFCTGPSPAVVVADPDCPLFDWESGSVRDLDAHLVGGFSAFTKQELDAVDDKQPSLFSTQFSAFSCQLPTVPLPYGLNMNDLLEAQAKRALKPAAVPDVALSKAAPAFVSTQPRPAPLSANVKFNAVHNLGPIPVGLPVPSPLSVQQRPNQQPQQHHQLHYSQVHLIDQRAVLQSLRQQASALPAQPVPVAPAHHTPVVVNQRASATPPSTSASNKRHLSSLEMVAGPISSAGKKSKPTPGPLSGAGQQSRAVFVRTSGGRGSPTEAHTNGHVLKVDNHRATAPSPPSSIDNHSPPSSSAGSSGMSDRSSSQSISTPSSGSSSPPVGTQPSQPIATPSAAHHAWRALVNKSRDYESHLRQYTDLLENQEAKRALHWRSIVIRVQEQPDQEPSFKNLGVWFDKDRGDGGLKQRTVALALKNLGFQIEACYLPREP